MLVDLCSTKHMHPYITHSPNIIIVYYNMQHFAWADQRPLQGNISYIALQPRQCLDITRERGQYLVIIRNIFPLMYTLNCSLPY